MSYYYEIITDAKTFFQVVSVAQCLCEFSTYILSKKTIQK